jgi:hypothetical protein
MAGRSGGTMTRLTSSANNVVTSNIVDRPVATVSFMRRMPSQIEGASSTQGRDFVPDPNQTRRVHLAEDSEVSMPAISQTAVPDDRPDGVEVTYPSIRLLRCDRAAGHLASHADDRAADGDGSPDPRVLLVRQGAIDLEKHSESTRINVVEARLACELRKRAVGD